MEKHKIELKAISVEFPGVKALDNCDFEIDSGDVRAVVGANGAGKSTLMKVLSGVYPHYTGDIYIDGNPIHIDSPITAKNYEIEIVYQEVDIALFPQLTVAENIMFNTMVSNRSQNALVNWSSINESAKKVLNDLKLDISPKTLVSKLSIAEKQMVLIARAMQQDCRFLILDEPTAPLSHVEAERLFSIVRYLSDEKNVGIIFISHRLPEVIEICKSITIMRNGKMVIHNKAITPDLTINEIVSHMLGASFDEIFPRKSTFAGKTLFEARSVCDREGKVSQVDILLREGEIIGISGLVGAGKTELSKILFGAGVCHAGEILIRGEKVNIKNTTIATQNNIALVPEERRKEGIFAEQNLISNLAIACINRFLDFFVFVNRKKTVRNAERIIQDLKIKTPSPFQKVKYLSGGNQQKVVIGKWLAADADIYIMDEPTKGIDVGAKREIFDLIYSFADQKKGVIYISQEVKEILSVTERVYVMYNGRIQKELITSETNEEEIMYYSTGGK